jgi:hypothetical protein
MATPVSGWANPPLRHRHLILRAFFIYPASSAWYLALTESVEANVFIAVEGLI